MKKVKRKQIDFGGTVEQVVRGDGSLGDYDKKVIVNLTTDKTDISEIENEALECDKTAEELINIFKSESPIEWRLIIKGEKPITYILEQGKVNIANSTTTIISTLRYIVYPYVIDITSNIHLYVRVDARYTSRTSRTGEVSESYTLTINANYYPTVLRTMNNEVLLPHTHGNANLHDGFYFPNAVQDYDGNWYGAVIIGDQVWLGENLKSIHYSDGEEIPEGHPVNIYGGNVDAARWYPNNDPETVPEYGCFYNWKAATRNENYEDTQTPVIGISPGTAENGDNIWHIPSLDELRTLISYIKNQQRYSDAIGRSVLKFDMDESQITNNKTGLNLPYAGYYYQNSQNFGERATLISSSLIVSGKYRTTASLNARNADLSAITSLYAMLMGSVRCVSNLTPIQFRNWYIEQYGSLQHDIIEEVKLCVETTWSDLTTLINNNGLTPGTKYRITDYNTTTVQTNTISANHPFDLIVTAIDVNKLDCKASAVLHENDNYFSTAGSNLSKWEIWYDIENNTTKYDWADNTNGKGVIYRIIDEFGNDCPYDFKNIKFLRNNEYIYTFTYKDLNNTSILADYSLNGAKCYNNVIKTFNSNKRTLNNITFLLNSLTDECHSNTFDCDSHDNTFFDAKYNTFGKECNYNNALQHCNYNTIDSQFVSNLLGSYFIGNTIGLSCYSNAFGNNTQYNNIGSNFKDNTIGHNFQSNVIINNVMHCTIGNYFVSSTIGANCTFSAANYVKNVIVQANNAGFNLDSTSPSTINDEPVYIQNVFITEGCITDREVPIRVTVDRNTIYRTTVAKTSDGTLRIYNEYDPCNAEDIHALPDTTKYGAFIDLDFDDTYTEVTDTTNKNPAEEGWFERSGTDPNYVYTLTEDTTPVSGKTYYKGGTYIITATLKDQDGNTLGTQQVVDLPLESVVVDGQYNSTTQNVELVLKNGHTIAFSVADLVSGLQTEITLANPLSADLLVSGTNNKVFTAADKTKLDSITPDVVWATETNFDSQTNTSDIDFTPQQLADYTNNGKIVKLVRGNAIFTLNWIGTNPLFETTQGANIYYLTYFDTDNKWHYFQKDLALKSEMSVTPGTGTNADKTTIQLKNGTTATVLTTHQDISGKADVNGNYPNMTVGIANNLDDKVTVEEAFLFRPSPNFKGTLGKSVRINEIKGRSNRWNQLVDTATSNVVLTSSHKYFTNISGTTSIQTGSGNSQAVTGGTDNVIDLTLVFGAGNEPETVEEFEAWLAANVGLKDYYPYDAGSLLSVKLEEFESIGFNQWDEEWELGNIDNTGVNTTSSSYIRSKNHINVIRSRTYYLNSNKNIDIYYYDYNKTFISTESITKNTTFAIPSNCCYIRFTVTGTVYNNDICISLPSSCNGEYQPYWKRTIPFDVTKITGINPNTNVRELVFPYGMRSAGSVYDRIYSNGNVAKAIVNIGSTTIGSLDWQGTTTTTSGVIRFKTNSLSSTMAEASISIRGASIDSIGNIICPKYLSVSSNSTNACNVGIAVDPYGVVTVYDSNYNSYTTWKTDMADVPIFYQLANPITYTDLQDEKGEPIELPLITKAANGGTERILPKNESSMDAIAPILNIEYQLDVEDRIDKLEETIAGRLLPTVTAADNGKILMVNDGAWSVESVPVSDSVLH